MSARPADSSWVWDAGSCSLRTVSPSVRTSSPGRLLSGGIFRFFRPPGLVTPDDVQGRFARCQRGPHTRVSVGGETGRCSWPPLTSHLYPDILAAAPGPRGQDVTRFRNWVIAGCERLSCKEATVQAGGTWAPWEGDIGTDRDTRRSVQRFRQRWRRGVRKPGVPEDPHVSCPVTCLRLPLCKLSCASSCPRLPPAGGLESVWTELAISPGLCHTVLSRSSSWHG